VRAQSTAALCGRPFRHGNIAAKSGFSTMPLFLDDYYIVSDAEQDY
jgi:hypothetical protein